MGRGQEIEPVKLSLKAQIYESHLVNKGDLGVFFFRKQNNYFSEFFSLKMQTLHYLELVYNIFVVT